MERFGRSHFSCGIERYCGRIHAAGLNAPGPIAVDANGYVWIANGNGSMAELDGTATPVNGSPFLGGGLATPAGMAIDQTGSIWVTNSGSPGNIAKFNSGGIALSPANGYTSGVANPLAITIDGSGNVWIQDANEQTDTYESRN